VSLRHAHGASDGMVDLRRLPPWLQFGIAVAVAAAVMWLAWTLRASHPGPAWIRRWLLPAWTVIGLAVLCGYAVRWILRHIRR
jgi:hypothetical protein